MEPLEHDGGNRLVWIALAGGFSLSTLIGGALHMQMTNWITHVDMSAAETAREVSRRAQISEGAIAEFRGADKAHEAQTAAHDRYHVLIEDRIRRTEQGLDDLRKRIEDLHDRDKDEKSGGSLDFDPTLDQLAWWK